LFKMFKIGVAGSLNYSCFSKIQVWS